MGTTKLIVKKSKVRKDGKTIIYVQYCHEQKTSLIATGEKIALKFWNQELGKVRRNKNHPELDLIQQVADKKKNAIDQIVRKAKLHDIEPTIDYVKNKFFEREEWEKGEKTPSFFEIVEDFILESKGTKVHGTIKGYKSAVNHLKAFEKYRRRPITFDQFNRKFYDSYCKYLFEKKDMNTNTVGRYIKHLKSFLNYAVDQGIKVPEDFHKFKVYKEEPEVIYLTSKELQTLVDLDLSNQKRLEQVRDVFCFGCFTGLRYSDIRQLKPSHIVNNQIHINTQKTRDALSIPLISQAQQILEKYEGHSYKSLPTVSNQKMNAYLKELCQLAGIDAPVNQVRYQGAKREDTIVPKYELVATHTARRTFITLSLEKGMRPEVLMQITGHRNYRTLMRYVKIVDKVKESEMLEAWGDKK